MSDNTPHLLGSSSAIRAVEAEIVYAARSDVKVLITGESGVGKEVVARLVHQRSRRGHMPMIAINCAGVPDALLESELFGHIRGSFTDAHRDRLGLFEMANGGTVFLDEVAEMSLRMQALLLRFLESGEIQRLGSDRTQTCVDVRVIAATNRNPLERIESKDFRDDLYYRLNVIHITVPPLRARREDIPLFFQYFLRAYAEQHGIAPPELEREALERLVAYDWPGNVRELKNAVERLIVRGRTGMVTLADLPAAIQVRRRETIVAVVPSAADALFERMVAGGEPFWSVVHSLFVARDLTRDDLRVILQKGLDQVGGDSKALVALFNMPPGDSKRFLSFLRKHRCQLPLSVPLTSIPDDIPHDDCGHHRLVPPRAFPGQRLRRM